MKQVALMIPMSKWYSYLAVVDDELADRLQYVDEEELYQLLEPHIEWASAAEESLYHHDTSAVEILSIEEVELYM